MTQHGLHQIKHTRHPQWGNARKDGGRRFAFPPYACSPIGHIQRSENARRLDYTIQHGRPPKMKLHHPAWENAAKDGGMRYAFPPYACWWDIKVRFSKALPNVEPMRPKGLARGGRGIWQKRFWEHTIRDDRDYRAHMDYVHFNPVKHGFVAHPADWPYSTFRKCAALGLYDPAWAPAENEITPFGMGERS